MVDPTLRYINRLFFLAFKNSGNDHMKDSLDVSSRNYMSVVEIKDFNLVIDNKPFFDQPIKINKKCRRNLSKCQETMILRKEIYYTTRITNFIINSMV